MVDRLPSNNFDADVSEQQYQTKVQGAIDELNTLEEEEGGGVSEQKDPTEAQATAPKSWSIMGTLGDIGVGITETPSQVLGGVRDAVQETYNALDGIANYYNEVDAFSSTEEELGNKLRGMAERIPDARISSEEDEPAQLPEVPEAESTTGTFVRSLSQFVTGFLPALKAVRAVSGGAKALNTLGGFAQTEVAAALGGALVFDPHEARLADFLDDLAGEENEDARNLAQDVTAYLRSDENDSEFEGRFKTGLESLLVGPAVQGAASLAKGFVRGLNAVKANRAEKGLPKDKPVGDDPLIVTGLGDPDAPLFGPSSVGAGQRITEPEVIKIPDLTVAGVIRNKPFQTNWAAVGETAQLGEIKQKLMGIYSQRINKARRGTISDEKLAELADGVLDDLAVALGLTVDDIHRINGSVMKAEEILASKALLSDGTEELVRLARVAEKSSDAADLHAFRVMRDKWASSAAFLQGHISEAARSLRASGIPEGSFERQMADLSAAVAGDGEDLRRLATSVRELADTGSTADLEKMLRGTMRKRVTDAISDVWYFNLLSGLRTMAVNALSSPANFAWQTAERSIASRWSRLTGNADGVEVGEASHMWYGAMQSFNTALRAAGRAARTNTSTGGLRKIERSRPQAITSTNFPIGQYVINVTKGSMAPELGEQVGMAIVKGIDALGFVSTLAGRSILAMDEFYGTMARSAELHALALRTVKKEGLEDSAAAVRYNELVENPDALSKETADLFAQDITFTSQLGKLGQNFQQTTNASLVGRLIVPFPRVAINIPKWAGRRTPLGFISSNIRSQIRTGGREGDLALARIGLGTMLGLTVVDLTTRGVITGAQPFDKELRASWGAQHQEFSVKIGDTYYAYDRTDPFGLILGAFSSYAQIFGELQPEDRDNMVYAMVMATTESVLNKTWLLGVTQALDALQEPNMSFDKFMRRTASTLLVPAAASQVAQAVDPVWREVNSMSEAVYKRVPGWGTDLPAHRDHLGEKMMTQFGFGSTEGDLDILDEVPFGEGVSFLNNFTPFSRFTPKDYPVNLWMFENRVGMKKPLKTQMGAELDPYQYDRFSELAGNEAKDPTTGLGFKDTMNSIIDGSHPQSPVWEELTGGPKGGQATFFSSMVTYFRQLAQQQLLEEDPEWASRVEAALEEQGEAYRETILFPSAGRVP